MGFTHDESAGTGRQLAMVASGIEGVVWLVIAAVSFVRTSTVYVGPAGDPDATDSLIWVQLDIALALINTALSVGILAVAMRWRGPGWKVAFALGGLTTLSVAMQVVVLSPAFRPDKMASPLALPVLLVVLPMLVVAIVKAARLPSPAPSRADDEKESSVPE